MIKIQEAAIRYKFNEEKVQQIYAAKPTLPETLKEALDILQEAAIAEGIIEAPSAEELKDADEAGLSASELKELKEFGVSRGLTDYEIETILKREIKLYEPSLFELKNFMAKFRFKKLKERQAYAPPPREETEQTNFNNLSDYDLIHLFETNDLLEHELRPALRVGNAFRDCASVVLNVAPKNPRIIALIKEFGEMYREAIKIVKHEHRNS